MQRVGFLLRVKPEKLPAYKEQHQKVWPELLAELKAAGIRNYSLWLNPDGLEFGYLECENWQAVCEYLVKSAVHERWQRFMGEYLVTPTNAELGGQPVELLELVFLLDDQP